MHKVLICVKGCKNIYSSKLRQEWQIGFKSLSCQLTSIGSGFWNTMRSENSMVLFGLSQKQCCVWLVKTIVGMGEAITATMP